MRGVKKCAVLCKVAIRSVFQRQSTTTVAATETIASNDVDNGRRNNLSFENCDGEIVSMVTWSLHQSVSLSTIMLNRNSE